MKVFFGVSKWLLISLLLAVTVANAQRTVNKRSVKRNQDSILQERLKYRINDLVSSQTRRNYNGLARLINFASRDQAIRFAKQMRQNELNNSPDQLYLEGFWVAHLYFVEDNKEWAFVEGCGKYRVNNKIVFLRSETEAVIKKGDWYFGGVIAAPELQPCEGFTPSDLK